MKNLNQYILESLKGYKPGTIDTKKPKEQLPEDCTGYFVNQKVDVDDIENLDTSKVTNMDSMFCDTIFNSNSDSLDLSSWDVSNVKDMSYMFQGCSIKYLDLSNWDLNNIKRMPCMFYICNNLEYLNVDNWDIKNVESLSYVFAACRNIKKLDLSTWNNTNNVCAIERMFNNCKSLEYLDISSLDTTNICIGNVDDYTVFMFHGCYNLTDIIFGPNFGKTLKVSAKECFTIDLGDCGKNKGYKLSDKTYESMLTMYDRKKAGLSPMKFIFNKKHNIPDGWIEKMKERGYDIKI